MDKKSGVNLVDLLTINHINKSARLLQRESNYKRRINKNTETSKNFIIIRVYG